MKRDTNFLFTEKPSEMIIKNFSTDELIKELESRGVVSSEHFVADNECRDIRAYGPCKVLIIETDFTE